MRVRVVHLGLSLLLPGGERGRATIREVAEVVSFRPKIFAAIQSAARQTKLPIASYVQEVIENDLAARRVASPPLPGSADATDSRRP